MGFARRQGQHVTHAAVGDVNAVEAVRQFAHENDFHAVLRMGASEVPS